MKDKTITVRVPDFCPEDCKKFKLCCDVTEFYAEDGRIAERHIRYACKHKDDCRRLYEQLETRYCADCRDAMKARGKI